MAHISRPTLRKLRAPSRIAPRYRTQMDPVSNRSERTRAAWLAVQAKYRGSMAAPDAERCWSREYDLASRDRIREIQNEKLAALTPFLYENSQFYRRRFDRLHLLPSDFQTVEDLTQWP